MNPDKVDPSRSDTTATTLSCLFFLLATDKPACVKLQEEIDIVFPQTAQLDVSKLSKMTYLQACINETLRLFPPVPSGLQRMTPKKGIFIGERFIPGDTIVTIPSYAQYRGNGPAWPSWGRGSTLNHGLEGLMNC